MVFGRFDPMDEILIYGDIWTYSAADFISAFSATDQFGNPKIKDSVVVRINSNGGSPEYMWGMVTKFGEFQGQKMIKVDGKAHSSALFFLAYADDVEAVDVASGVLHRAAYPSWYESDYMTENQKMDLVNINKHLKAAFEAKIDVEKFEKLKGITLDAVFSMDSRIDVSLTAQEMKKIGLINRIVSITPQKKTKISARMIEVAAKYGLKPEEELPEITAEKVITKQTNKNMTIEEIRAQHPAVFAQILAMGAASEKDRVQAWMAFVDVDTKAVAEGIESSAAPTMKVMAEMSMKMASSAKLESLKGEAAPVIVPGEIKKDADETPAAKLEANLMASLKDNGVITK